jgi:hypothetical protein
MRKPGVDPNNVQMSDVLCDFCLREWTEDVLFIEGHQGSCICGPCLTQAWGDLASGRCAPADDYLCPMCREKNEDRAALGRADEPGWQGAHAAICQRCMQLAATALEKDPESGWRRPM